MSCLPVIYFFECDVFLKFTIGEVLTKLLDCYLLSSANLPDKVTYKFYGDFFLFEL